MMKKLVFLLIVVLAVSVIAVTASASPPQEAGGVWFYLPQTLDTYKEVGGNQFMNFTELGMWTGAISGEADESGSGMIRSNGTWTFNLTAQLDEATVNGETGSLEIRAMGYRAAGEENWTGTWLIVGGTLHDDGLRGRGTLEGPGWQGDPTAWGEIPYEGSIHFESH